MKLHRFAALAFVGWYLMLPPLRIEGPTSDPNTPVRVDTNAPLSQWRIIAGFETAKECHDYPAHFLDVLQKSKGPVQGRKHRNANAAAKRWFDASECIAAHDPRVAGMKPPAN
jgi:hypothetical protein